MVENTKFFLKSHESDIGQILKVNGWKHFKNEAKYLVYQPDLMDKVFFPPH